MFLLDVSSLGVRDHSSRDDVVHGYFLNGQAARCQVHPLTNQNWLLWLFYRLLERFDDIIKVLLAPPSANQELLSLFWRRGQAFAKEDGLLR